MTIDVRIARNVAIHDRMARRYDALHGEIFNTTEQARLQGVLSRAKDAVRSGGMPILALDFGCGSGNLTRHLLGLGMKVTAAAVSYTHLTLPTKRIV